MPDADVAEAFLRFLNPADPRLLEDNELERRWSKFLQQRLTCPMEHTNAGVANFGGGVTHFYCREKNCDAVWDLEGNAVSEDEDDE
jgi:hypothetical protein